MELDPRSTSKTARRVVAGVGLLRIGVGVLLTVRPQLAGRGTGAFRTMTRTVGIRDIALAVAVPSRCQDGAVASESDGVRLSRVVRGMDIARCHGDDVFPQPDTALAGRIASHGENSPVPAATD